MKKNSLIRTIYLYLFALVGLALLVISTVRFIDMGLKAFVFTKADEEQRIYYKQPPVPVFTEKLSQGEIGTLNLTEAEMTQVRNLISDYENWKAQADSIDPITSQRHKSASINLSMIIIGFPLYLYHWSVIRRETKEKEA